MNIFQNSKWAVTDGWLETTRQTNGEPDYVIPMERIMEVRTGAPDYYAWPLHLAEKDWADVPLFLEAFNKAIRYHAKRTHQRIDADMLAATYRLAIRMALLTQMYEVDSLRRSSRPRLALISDFLESPEMKLYDERERALDAIDYTVSRHRAAE